MSKKILSWLLIWSTFIVASNVVFGMHEIEVYQNAKKNVMYEKIMADVKKGPYTYNDIYQGYLETHGMLKHEYKVMEGARIKQRLSTYSHANMLAPSLAPNIEAYYKEIETQASYQSAAAARRTAAIKKALDNANTTETLTISEITWTETYDTITEQMTPNDNDIKHILEWLKLNPTVKVINLTGADLNPNITSLIELLQIRNDFTSIDISNCNLGEATLRYMYKVVEEFKLKQEGQRTEAERLKQEEFNEAMRQNADFIALQKQNTYFSKIIEQQRSQIEQQKEAILNFVKMLK